MLRCLCALNATLYDLPVTGTCQLSNVPKTPSAPGRIKGLSFASDRLGAAPIVRGLSIVAMHWTRTFVNERPDVLVVLFFLEFDAGLTLGAEFVKIHNSRFRVCPSFDAVSSIRRLGYLRWDSLAKWLAIRWDKAGLIKALGQWFQPPSFMEAIWVNGMAVLLVYIM